MPQTRPWHDPTETCFHDNTECAFGEKVPAEQRIEGSGGRELCRLCERLDRAEQRVKT